MGTFRKGEFPAERYIKLQGGFTMGRLVVFREDVNRVINPDDFNGLRYKGDGHYLLAVFDVIFIARHQVWLIAKSELWGLLATRTRFNIQRYLNGLEELCRAGWIQVVPNKEGVEVLFPNRCLLDRYDGDSFGCPRVTENN